MTSCNPFSSVAYSTKQQPLPVTLYLTLSLTLPPSPARDSVMYVTQRPVTCLPPHTVATTAQRPSVTLSFGLPSRLRLSRTTAAHVSGCLWEVLLSPPASALPLCLPASSSLLPSSPLNLYEYYLHVFPLWTKKPSRLTGKKGVSGGSEGRDELSEGRVCAVVR